MKRTILLMTAAIFTLAANAQTKEKKKVTATKPAVVSPAPEVKPITKDAAVPAQMNATPVANNQNPDLNMKFNTEDHNFGNIPEGPAVSYDFEFKNIGKEPITLTTVNASCGCTTPTWTKEPILPGKTGKITATYNTQGRPGNFTKTITVNSNVGTKILKIQGNVEKAPDSSVPANNNSMIKH